MRVHDIIDACIQHVAMDGIIDASEKEVVEVVLDRELTETGTDPLSLQLHLTTIEPTFDTASFLYIYSLLCKHPSIAIAVSTYPLPLSDGSIRPGVVAIPDDYVAPTTSVVTRSDFDNAHEDSRQGASVARAMREQDHSVFNNKRKRVMDDIYRSDYERRLRRSRKEAGDILRERQSLQLLNKDDKVLMTFLEEDDGALEAGEPARKDDLAGLMYKWGSRLRITTVPHETYFRLVGSHHKQARMSSMVVAALQLAARARADGISAIDIRKIVDTSPGTVHYLMKILLQMGLCHKVPAVQESVVTNYLVYHPFLLSNPYYRAQHGLAPDFEPSITASAAVDEVSVDGIQIHEFNTAPLTDAELIGGVIVKDRLIRLLDHPLITTHLVATRNLLPVLGWKGPILIRHRRSFRKHARALMDECILESVAAGPGRTECFRLTKYNPHHAHVPKAPVVPKATVPADSVEEPMIYAEADFAEPYNRLGGITSTRTLERQMNEAIAESGTAGVTIADLQRTVGNPYRRAVEFHFARAENQWQPESMDDFQISTAIDTTGKERHVRAWETQAYREKCFSVGQPPDDYRHPPRGSEAGRFADVTYREFVKDQKEHTSMLNKIADGVFFGRMNEQAKASFQARVAQRTGGRNATSRKGKGTKAVEDGVALIKESKPRVFRPKAMQYKVDSQVRGRPRKYLYVVTPEGKVNRAVIGQVLPHASLAPIWIYVKDKDLLVPAPSTYAGQGPVPPVTAEMVAQGKSPEYFDRFPSNSKGKQAKRDTKRRKVVKQEGPEDAQGPAAGAGDVDAAAVGQETAAQMAREVVGGTARAGGDNMPAVGGDVPVPVPAAREASVVPIPTRSGADQVVERRPRKRRQATAAAPQHAGSTLPDLNMDAPAAGEGVAAVSAPAAGPLDGTRGDAEHIEALPEPAPKRTKRTRGANVGDGDDRAPSIPLPVVAPGPDPSSRPASARTTPHLAVAVLPPSPKLVPLAAHAATRSSKPPSEASPPPKTMPAITSGNAIEKPAAAAASSPRLAATKAPTPRVGRMMRPNERARAAPAKADFGLVKRCNELVEALRAHNGVLSYSQLLTAHREWVVSVAGTGVPHAPAVPYGMDRTIFYRAVDHLADSGQVKRTIVAGVPTTTGRWWGAGAVWLPGVPQDRIDAYMSEMAQATSQALLAKKLKQQTGTVVAEAFTNVQLLRPEPPTTIAQVRNERISLTGSARRESLLHETGVGATLLGFIPGANLRVRALHNALHELVNAHQAEPSVTSMAPKVFALPLVFEWLPVGVFYQIALSTVYEESLEAWLADADNWRTPLKLVPSEMRIAGQAGFAGAHNKNKIRTLLAALHFLRLITPIKPCVEQEADVDLGEGSRGPRYFKVLADVGPATHFVLYDFAPVYHVATDDPALLGVMPVSLPHERDLFWTKVERACVEPSRFAEHERIASVDARPPFVAPLEPRLSADRDRLKPLQSWARWSSELRLLPDQQKAFDKVISPAGDVLIGEVEIKRFAYENALPLDFTRDYLVKRAHRIRKRLETKAKQAADDAKAIAARRERAQNALRARVDALRQRGREEWEDRIRVAAERNGRVFTAELAQIVGRRAANMVDRAQIDEQAMDAMVNHAHALITEARKQAGVEGGLRSEIVTMDEAAREAILEKARQLNTPSLVRLAKSNPVGFAAPLTDGKRNRHSWKPEEDDLLIDCEAIIRARSIDNGGKGRKALAQIPTFQKVPYLALGNRVKKLLEDNARLAYFRHLVETWYKIWVAKRGTPELPDVDIHSNENFDLTVHLAYLRQHVTKSEVSAIASAAPATLGPAVASLVDARDLPADVGDFVDECRWRSRDVKTTALGVIYNQGTDDARMTHALAAKLEQPRVSAGKYPRARGVHRATLKMIVSTPTDTYDMQRGQNLLHATPEPIRSSEIDVLLSEDILIRHYKSSKTGRAYDYPAIWGTLTDGPVLPEVFPQAAAFDRKAQEGYDMPVTADLGEYAELFERISEGTIDLDFDVREMPCLHKERSYYNTRKLNDDAFEMTLRVKTEPRPTMHADLPVVQGLLPPTSWPVVETAPDAEIVERVVELAREAGEDGVSKSTLYDELDNGDNVRRADVDAALATLAEETPSRVFWAGYDVPRLVLVALSRSWRVPTKAKETGQPRLTAPRRWTDVYGDMLQDDFMRCVRGAVAHVSMRPGVCETVLRARLGDTMDRIETNEVLQYALDAGMVWRDWASRRYAHEEARGVMPPVEATGEEEAGEIVWMPQRPFSAMPL